MPHLAHVQVLDNNAQAAPGESIPNLVLEMTEGRLVFPDPGNARVLAGTPEWARPEMQAAIESESRK